MSCKFFGHASITNMLKPNTKVVWSYTFRLIIEKVIEPVSFTSAQETVSKGSSQM